MMMNCPIHKKWLEALAKSVAKHHQWRGDFCSCGYQYRIAGPKVINKDHKKSFKKQGHLVFDNILAGVGHFPDGGITFTSCTGTQFPQDSLQILVGCGVVCCLLEDQTIDKELMKPWYEALYDKMISELKLLPVPHPSTTKMTFVGASLAACSKVTDYQVTPNDQQQLVHISEDFHAPLPPPQPSLMRLHSKDKCENKKALIITIKEMFHLQGNWAYQENLPQKTKNRDTS
eukprot:TRINITY_DN381_c0_g1_i2.p1 TRINITY_DN381_c0_g1~~TRINITY_DN381_c0_g1_i2.p1  ORF type:complete len:231 (-),score=40.43 TRINITY_DN381_c0_g1_i2:240-932(-)